MPQTGSPDLDVSSGKLKGIGVLAVTPGVKVTRRFAGSTWGTFTIFLTIPIALFVGWYMYRFRKGKVLEAAAIGGLLTLGAVYLKVASGSDGGRIR